MWGFLKQQCTVTHRLSWDLCFVVVVVVWVFCFCFYKTLQEWEDGLWMTNVCNQFSIIFARSSSWVHLLDLSSGRANPFAVDWPKTNQDKKSKAGHKSALKNQICGYLLPSQSCLGGGPGRGALRRFCRTYIGHWAKRAFPWQTSGSGSTAQNVSCHHHLGDDKFFLLAITVNTRGSAVCFCVSPGPLPAILYWF